MQSGNAVFKYSEAREFLQDKLEEKKRKNRSFSLRAWSKQLGFKNPSLLCSILSGKRNLSSRIARRIGKAMKMTTEEETYLELLALRETAEDGPEKEYIDQGLKTLAIKHRARRIKLAEFKLIAEWHHVAILEMLNLKHFTNDPAAISAKLKFGITPEQVKEAIRRLKVLRLLTEDASGVLHATAVENKVGDEIPDEAVKRHQSQMMQIAIDTHHDEPMGERDIRGSIFAIRSEDFSKAIEILRNCHAQLRNLSAPTDNDFVCRFSTQLFKLTT